MRATISFENRRITPSGPMRLGGPRPAQRRTSWSSLPTCSVVVTSSQRGRIRGPYRCRHYDESHTTIAGGYQCVFQLCRKGDVGADQGRTVLCNSPTRTIILLSRCISRTYPNVGGPDIKTADRNTNTVFSDTERAIINLGYSSAIYYQYQYTIYSWHSTIIRNAV